MATTPFPIGGMGAGIFSGGGFPGEEPVKKFSSAECLGKLLESIGEEPMLVRQHIKIFNSDQQDLLRDKLWPAIFDNDNWTRTSTHRPTHDDEGEKLIGSDREVRTYENDIWEAQGKSLVGVVTSEHGEITDVKVQVRW